MADQVPRGRGFGPDFRYLWTATIISGVGDGMRVTAFALFAAALTRNALLVSVVTVAGQFPASPIRRVKRAAVNSDSLGFAFEQELVRSKRKHREFDARRAAVEGEDAPRRHHKPLPVSTAISNREFPAYRLRGCRCIVCARSTYRAAIA